MQDANSLSASHGAQLVQLANDRSQKGRALLTTAIVELFSEDAEVFTDSDLGTMTEIIVQLVANIETSVKTALAERLSETPNVPRELAVHFAEMEAGIAFPILRKSAALKDPDLISIVLHKTKEHQMAVSMRSIIPAGVSKVLAESEHDEVIRSLLDNEGATIDDETFRGIAGRTTEETIFNTALVRRNDLPSSVAKQLYWAVSAALRQKLIVEHGVDENSVDDAIEDVIPELIKGSAEPDSDEDVKRQVEVAVRNGVLGKALLALLQSAEIGRFTSWFATAGKLREELAGKIMFEEGGECLAAIFKTLDIERDEFLSIFVLLRQGRLGDQRVPEREVAGASEFYDNIKLDKAAALLKRLQRNPEYLNAMRVVGSKRA